MGQEEDGHPRKISSQADSFNSLTYFRGHSGSRNEVNHALSIASLSLGCKEYRTVYLVT